MLGVRSKGLLLHRVEDIWVSRRDLRMGGTHDALLFLDGVRVFCSCAYPGLC
jgi:hypothetical protein